MAGELTITTCRIVAWVDKFDAPSNEVFGFEEVRYHTDGTVTPANGTSTTENNVEGFATVESDRVGQGITVVRDGLLDIGNALSGVAIGAPLFSSDTDGQIATSAGSNSVIVGRCAAGWGSLTSDKLFLVRKGG